MNCSRLRENLHTYAKGECDKAEEYEILMHLGNCSACSKELDEIKKVKQLLINHIEKAIIPLDLSDSIILAIDHNRYKKALNRKVIDISNWGRSMIAAGVIILVMNIFQPMYNGQQIQNNLVYATGSIGEKIVNKVDSINSGIAVLKVKLIELNGITSRVERNIRGGK